MTNHITPRRVNKLITLGMVVFVASILSSIISVFSVGTTVHEKLIVKTVVDYKEVLVASDSAKINLFIDELLTPKSAKCFKAILIHESHMNPNAKNPNSSARGVGQLLTSTYRNLGMKHSTDGLAQTVAALAYVGRFYGSAGPCGAWKHWQIHNWY